MRSMSIVSIVRFIRVVRSLESQVYALIEAQLFTCKKAFSPCPSPITTVPARCRCSFRLTRFIFHCNYPKPLTNNSPAPIFTINILAFALCYARLTIEKLNHAIFLFSSSRLKPVDRRKYVLDSRHGAKILRWGKFQDVCCFCSMF